MANTLIGYRVKNCNGYFLDTDGDGINYATYKEPTPIARGDAYRRLAAYLDAYPHVSDSDMEVVPVHRALTPTESAAQELGSLLSTLTRRHGLQLGLTQDQIEAKIAKELEELGAGSIVSQIARFR
jgi:hypothetical protein